MLCWGILLEAGGLRMKHGQINIVALSITSELGLEVFRV